MSVIARIKPKGLFKKKMSIQEIIGYTNLSYGVCDENYRLIENEIAKHTLLYDNAKPARGIDISMDEFDVVLQLSLPTTPSEIHLFYNTIQSLCNLYKVTTYIREEEKVHIKENEKFIRYDIEGSIEGLKDIESKIQKNTYQRFEIFGIYNPISIGINEINKFHHDLNQFEDGVEKRKALTKFALRVVSMAGVVTFDYKTLYADCDTETYKRICNVADSKELTDKQKLLIMTQEFKKYEDEVSASFSSDLKNELDRAARVKLSSIVAMSMPQFITSGVDEKPVITRGTLLSGYTEKDYQLHAIENRSLQSIKVSGVKILSSNMVAHLK